MYKVIKREVDNTVYLEVSLKELLDMIAEDYPSFCISSINLPSDQPNRLEVYLHSKRFKDGGVR